MIWSNFHLNTSFIILARSIKLRLCSTVVALNLLLIYILLMQWQLLDYIRIITTVIYHSIMTHLIVLSIWWLFVIYYFQILLILLKFIFIFIWRSSCYLFSWNKSFTEFFYLYFIFYWLTFNFWDNILLLLVLLWHILILFFSSFSFCRCPWYFWSAS